MLEFGGHLLGEFAQLDVFLLGNLDEFVEGFLQADALADHHHPGRGIYHASGFERFLQISDQFSGFTEAAACRTAVAACSANSAPITSAGGPKESSTE